MKKAMSILMTTVFVFLCGLVSSYVLGGQIMRSSLAFAVGVGIASFAIIFEEARCIDLHIEDSEECEG
jgi:hypothetical protein